MAEDHKHQDQHEPPSQTTASSNQNLIIGIVMGAAVLLLLLLVISEQFGGKDNEEDQEVTKLKAQIEEARKAKNSVYLNPNQNSNPSANGLASRIKQDVDSLNGILVSHENTLREIDGLKATVQTLTQQNTDLNYQLQRFRDDAQKVPGLEAEIARMRANASLTAEQLANAVDPATVEALRAQLTTSRNDTNRLAAELAKLKQDTANMVDRNQLAVIQAQITPLEEMNRKLRAELQRLRAEADRSKLFVTRDKLAPVAQKLFGELVRLEGNKPDTLQSSYERISQSLNARVVESAEFETNSAALAMKHEEHIKTIALQAPGNAFFLVVGYASKTGDLQANRELSSKRSTRVASVVNVLKQNGQDVQAVYLGETDRFGTKAAPNQVCEIWEIRP
jgi:outer membrane protein OmpA-like peptidoglycan-associated protein